MAAAQRDGSDSRSNREYTLVVAVADLESVEQLLRTAIDLARANDGSLLVVTVVHKTATSPFRLFHDERIKAEFAGGHHDVLERAVRVAENASVPVEDRLLIGTDVAGAILTAVEDVEADELFLGWQERPRPSDIVLGTTVDPVIRRAPCDVFVERVGTTADGVDSVLLSTVGGPHVRPATELVAAVAAANDATATVVSYVDPDGDETERMAARDHVESASKRLPDVPVDGAVRESDDVADSIVTAADDHDLVVLGATRERRFRRQVVGTVAETVSRRAAPPVVIAKRHSERSLLSSVFDRW
ncbi:universal stress protein [Natronobeatus ordinarius]|uniref:universal stress protein n=1 Tax=Natronobeatus ordinarius TaxID=2963433 RepID=UPI0020CEACD1|nr:universal stress protein [Natronobeatus ordinarius]